MCYLHIQHSSMLFLLLGQNKAHKSKQRKKKRKLKKTINALQKPLDVVVVVVVAVRVAVELCMKNNYNFANKDNLRMRSTTRYNDDCNSAMTMGQAKQRRVKRRWRGEES